MFERNLMNVSEMGIETHRKSCVIRRAYPHHNRWMYTEIEVFTTNSFLDVITIKVCELSENAIMCYGMVKLFFSSALLLCAVRKSGKNKNNNMKHL